MSFVSFLSNGLLVWPFEQVKTLPFNKYSWLTTHNSFARLGDKSATGSLILAPTNQQDSITDQLNVRVLSYLLHFSAEFILFSYVFSREEQTQTFFVLLAVIVIMMIYNYSSVAHNLGLYLEKEQTFG